MEKVIRKNTFNITATNLTVGERQLQHLRHYRNGSPPTAPGVTPLSFEHVVALFNQFMAAGFPHQHGATISNALSQIVANEQQFLAQPLHG